MDLARHLAQFLVIVGVAQPIIAPERQPELLGHVREEILVVQIALGLDDQRLGLVELRKRQEDRDEIAERFVQRAGLRIGARTEPAGLERIEYGVAAFVRDDVERARLIVLDGDGVDDEAVAESEDLDLLGQIERIGLD